MILYAAVHGYIDDVELNKMASFESGLLDFAESNYKDLMNSLDSTGAFSDEIEKQLKEIVEKFKASQG